MYKKIFIGLIVLLSFSIQADPAIKISGNIEQGGLVIGKTEPGNKVKFGEQSLFVSANGDYVFGFGRDEKKEFILSITDLDGKTSKIALTPEKQEYKIQRIEGIPQKIMKPNPKAVTRSRNDNKTIREARAIKSNLTDFSQGFTAPINGTITGVYGSQRFFNGEAKRPHYGLDYAGKTGDPVHAPASGIVTMWVPDMFYSGGTMLIDHGHGINSTFLHLSKSYVKVGDKIKQGQLIAAVGSSGRATGPHLDWRVNWFKVRLDPALALNIRPL